MNTYEEHINDLTNAVYYAISCSGCSAVYEHWDEEGMADGAFAKGWRTNNEASPYCPKCAERKKL